MPAGKSRDKYKMANEFFSTQVMLIREIKFSLTSTPFPTYFNLPIIRFNYPAPRIIYCSREQSSTQTSRKYSFSIQEQCAARLLLLFSLRLRHGCLIRPFHNRGYVNYFVFFSHSHHAHRDLPFFSPATVFKIRSFLLNMYYRRKKFAVEERRKLPENSRSTYNLEEFIAEMKELRYE